MPARAGRRGRPAERHQRDVGRDAWGWLCRPPESVTFFRKKPGHLLMPGRLTLRGGLCRRYRHSRLGARRSSRPKTFENLPALCGARDFPVPRHDGHKYDRGHAVVVSGPSWSTGAARLAARGALRAGAGLVTIASPREALAVNAAASLAVMVRPVDGADELDRISGRPQIERAGDWTRSSASAKRPVSSS